MARIIIDLETAPIVDVDTYLVEPVSAPAHYKDETKIAAYIAEEQKKRRDRASLDPDLCRIVCLGWMREDIDREPVVLPCATELAERQALQRLWADVGGASIITFNGFRFDLPVLMRRSLFLDLAPGAWTTLSVDKYRSPHVDLWQRLSFNGAISAHSLPFYAQRFGFWGDHDVTGAEVGALVAEGQWVAIADHCRQDVWWTAQLAKKLGVWRGATSRPAIVSPSEPVLI